MPLFLALVLLAANAAPAWLDAAKPANWNVAHAPLPRAPATKDRDLTSGGLCASAERPATSPEDRQVVRAGWSLFEPYERFGPTSVVLAASGADGMCRPLGFQAFVFVDGTFAGTLSPRLMDSRTDAALAGGGVDLQDAHALVATFVRYSDGDALCCPHAETTVSYSIGRDGVRPVDAATVKTSTP